MGRLPRVPALGLLLALVGAGWAGPARSHVSGEHQVAVNGTQRSFVAATMVEPSCQPRSPVAVLHIHGAEDERIPLKGGRGEMTAADRSWPAPQQGVASWTKFDSCAGDTTSRRDGDANCTTYGQCRAAVEYCVIERGGHVWPRGASERIWTFFAAHPKPSS